jgi:hypothetical protein
LKTENSSWWDLSKRRGDSRDLDTVTLIRGANIFDSAGHRNGLTVFCVAVFIDPDKSSILSSLREL